MHVAYQQSRAGEILLNIQSVAIDVNSWAHSTCELFVNQLLEITSYASPWLLVSFGKSTMGY